MLLNSACRYTSNKHSTTSLSSFKMKLKRFSNFQTFMPIYGNPAPASQTSNFVKISKILISLYLASRFQRALNDFPIFIQTEIRAIYLFLTFMPAP